MPGLEDIAQGKSAQDGTTSDNSASDSANQANTGGDSKMMLEKLAGSDFSNMTTVVKFVKDGAKLDNSSMQELLYRLKTKHGMTYRELLSIYITLDMAVEKGVLTNDIIDYLKKNPDMIKKF